MSTLFLSGTMIIRNLLFTGKEKPLHRLPAQSKGKQADTITVFEREKQKRVRQMAYWETAW